MCSLKGGEGVGIGGAGCVFRVHAYGLRNGGWEVQWREGIVNPRPSLTYVRLCFPAVAFGSRPYAPALWDGSEAFADVV